MNLIGNLSKMHTELDNNQAQYFFVLDNTKTNNSLNNYLDKKITIEFLDQINCIYCNREIKKTFNQGYCFPCFRKLARCDSCIISPEKCHFHMGTCREPSWGLDHCMQNHYVYLAYSSGLKVGLTRENQIPTRWIDQGATQAIIIAQTRSRYQAGLLEVICKEFVNDKTNWREMLKNTNNASDNQIDLFKERDLLFSKINVTYDKFFIDYNNFVANNIENYKNLSQTKNILNQNSSLEINLAKDETVQEICYPVQHYPIKITSLNLEKTPKISGTLLGIKGQYLILDIGVINIRKYTGYKVKITT